MCGFGSKRQDQPRSQERGFAYKKINMAINFKTHFYNFNHIFGVIKTRSRMNYTFYLKAIIIKLIDLICSKFKGEI